MKKSLLLIGLLGIAGALQAQEGFTFSFHGFVNPHYYADSRSVVGGREDMMLFYPKPIVRDSLGRDMNDGWQANMLAITARLNVKIKPRPLSKATSPAAPTPPSTTCACATPTSPSTGVVTASLPDNTGTPWSSTKSCP